MTSPITAERVDAFIDRGTWWVVYAALGLLTFDVLSTWLGICALGGFELNIAMTRTIQTIGYAPTAMVLFCVWTGMGLWVRRTLTKKVRNRNMKVLMFAVIVIALLHYAVVVPNNGLLLLKLSGSDVFIGGSQVDRGYVIDQGYVPESYVQQAVAEFDRERFCRLFP